MTTQQFIKEHRFKKAHKHIMYHPKENVFIAFDGDANIFEVNGINPTHEEVLSIHNLIINYLDDLYMSEFDEIKSYHEDTTK